MVDSNGTDKEVVKCIGIDDAMDVLTGNGLSDAKVSERPGEINAHLCT